MDKYESLPSSNSNEDDIYMAREHEKTHDFENSYFTHITDNFCTDPNEYLGSWDNDKYNARYVKNQNATNMSNKSPGPKKEKRKRRRSRRDGKLRKEVNPIDNIVKINMYRVCQKEHYNQDIFKYLIDWMKNGGAKTSKLKLECYSENFRGVHAAQDFRKDTEVLFIP